jgi:peroxiredoxin
LWLNPQMIVARVDSQVRNEGSILTDHLHGFPSLRAQVCANELKRYDRRNPCSKQVRDFRLTPS